MPMGHPQTDCKSLSMALLRFASLLLCVTAFAAAEKSEGEQCLPATGKNPAWTCKVLQNCAPAQKLIKEKKTPPARRKCGYKGGSLVVCCPPYEIADWNSVEPISTTSTSTLVNKVNDGTSMAAVMCDEYTRLVRTQISDMSSNDGSKPSGRRRCKLQDLIVGGADAEPQEFPHMALLGYGSNPPSYHCGGSLISDKFILSAAHCERHQQLGPVKTILLGDLDISSESDDAAPESFKVSRIYVHPSYTADSLYNDIMLIELEKRVQFNGFIRPLCLQVISHIKARTGIATGWGRLEAGYALLETTGSSKSRLQKIELPLISDADCDESFSGYYGTKELEYGIKNDTQFCAGAEENKDSCEGDSGGPLQIPLGDCMYSQVGIVSFGRQCGTAGSPGVYTRVSAFIPWIEKIVWPQS